VRREDCTCQFFRRWGRIILELEEFTGSRTAWVYQVDVPRCSDTCTENDIVVRCLVTDDEFCDPEPLCPLADSYCLREFIFQEVCSD
jgi:hypothetical protein